MDVSTQFETPKLTCRFHDKNEATVVPALHNLAVRKAISPRLAQMVRASRFYRRCIRPAISRCQDYPPLSDELRSKLVDYYRQDVLRLSELMGRSLPCWLSEEVQSGSRGDLAQ